MPFHDHHRRGITLLEVLISIGILSIGLASVLALLPAGGSVRGAFSSDLSDTLAIGLSPDSTGGVWRCPDFEQRLSYCFHARQRRFRRAYIFSSDGFAGAQ